MIEYETKTMTSKFKIGDRQYDIKITQLHCDGGPKISIQANSGSSGFHVEIFELDVIEVSSALNEIVNTLATMTHVHYSGPAPAVSMTPSGSFYHR